MSDYAPSTSTVRQAWYEAPYNGGGGREMSDAELDRWLESIRAEAAKRFPDDGEQIVRYVIQRARSAYVDGYLAAAAVLPEVERHAKADAWDEAYQAGAYDTLRSPAEATENPYREKGDDRG